jgi:tRNA(Arg) A34 adenosine deaminase TadA
MSSSSKIKRSDSLPTMIAASGGAAPPGNLLTVQIPPDLEPESPLAQNWNKPVHNVAEVDLAAVAPELANEQTQERHRIYCYLLMSLVRRFWNGNNKGPVGIYPFRAGQKLSVQVPDTKFFRYRGDMLEPTNSNRINWDRYLGHNIACLAVDGNGEVIDFDFNHNNIFRSSAEHAEARIVRRLFSLTNIFDNWNTGARIDGKSHSFSLQNVTIYTSLESCAQCSGVMSLGRVKQVVYLQNDPGAYRIGNIMFNLAGLDDQKLPLAAIPVPASSVGLPYLSDLNGAFVKFSAEIENARQQNDESNAFFVPPDDTAPDFGVSITSFLCTDAAFDIFDRGANEFRRMSLKFPGARPSGVRTAWTNRKCLDHAGLFYKYADEEGYRGSPHKL